MNTATLLTMAAAFVSISVYVPAAHFEDQMKAYCENVRVWESQSNLPEHERDGHINYREKNCERAK